MTERRAICRECGRGSDAPHTSICETGRTRDLYAGFDLGVAMLAWADATERETA